MASDSKCNVTNLKIKPVCVLFSLGCNSTYPQDFFAKIFIIIFHTFK